jgi:Rieske Fe-S protein
MHIPAALVCKGLDNFSAFSLVCTVEQKNEQYERPCHGSVFNREGQLEKGPAERALQRLRVTKNEEGNLILHMK